MDEDQPPVDADKGPIGVVRNADAHWDRFDPDAYFKANYASLRTDDAEILSITGTHFAQALSVEGAGARRAIDMGAGVNIYPSMAMLPYCGAITLYEFAQPNLDWLERERSTGWARSWKDGADDFWAVLAHLPHGEITAPLDELDKRLEIRPGSLYDLPAGERWDLGTMFFVAESITEDPEQFRLGIDRFLECLVPGAPFVIALMEHRTNGYHAGTQSFPSTDVGETDIQKYLDLVAQDVSVKHVDVVGHDPLKDPYGGMVVAWGRTHLFYD